MITTEDIKRISKTGEEIQEGKYRISLKKEDGYWYMKMYEPGVGGASCPYAKILTNSVLQRMVDTIYKDYDNTVKGSE